MRKIIAFLFFVVIFSGNFSVSPEKSWTEHLLDDCNCNQIRVCAINKVIVYDGDDTLWIIFWNNGEIFLEEMR